MNLVVWVLWGEIKVNFNDVKHIVHLIRRFYGLGNTIMTCFHDYHQFYGSFQSSSGGLDRRLLGLGLGLGLGLVLFSDIACVFAIVFAGIAQIPENYDMERLCLLLCLLVPHPFFFFLSNGTHTRACASQAYICYH